MITWSSKSPGARTVAPPIVLAVALLIVACGLPACSRKDASRAQQRPALVTAAQFEPLLLELLRRADPQGAVLLAFWSKADPIPKDLAALADRWRRYGLVTLAVLVDEEVAAGDDDAARRGPGREERPPSPLRGIRFSGTLAEIERIVRASAKPPSALLLNPEGKSLWSSEGFRDLDGLEAVIQVHLGEPSVADGEEGCVCMRLWRRVHVGPRESTPARGPAHGTSGRITPREPA
jgi:hypothetical protein